jgi:hypothetical protein
LIRMIATRSQEARNTLRDIVESNITCEKYIRFIDRNFKNGKLKDLYDKSGYSRRLLGAIQTTRRQIDRCMCD